MHHPTSNQLWTQLRFWICAQCPLIGCDREIMLTHYIVILNSRLPSNAIDLKQTKTNMSCGEGAALHRPQGGEGFLFHLSTYLAPQLFYQIRYTLNLLRKHMHCGNASSKMCHELMTGSWRCVELLWFHDLSHLKCRRTSTTPTSWHKNLSVKK